MAAREVEIPFTEAIRPPLWLMGFVYFLFLSFALSVWAAMGNTAGLISLLLLSALLIYLRQLITMRISVTSKELFIDRAHIDINFIGDVEVLTPEKMRLIRGRDADPAAFLAIRFWESSGVKITLNDKRDPTPYWLVSSRKSEELKRTLYIQR
jgi:hypothetical protein